MRTLIVSGLTGLWLQSAEPQPEQYAFPKPSEGWKTRTSSSPATIRSELGASRADTEAAVPVRRWHRPQWQ